MDITVAVKNITVKVKNITEVVAYARDVRRGIIPGDFITPEDIAKFYVDPLELDAPLLVRSYEWIRSANSPTTTTTEEALGLIPQIIRDLLNYVNGRLKEDKRGERLVLSGGSALRSLLGDNGWDDSLGVVSDYDMYVLDAKKPEDVRRVISMVAAHLPRPVEDLESVPIYIGKGVVNFYANDPTGHTRRLKIQVMNMILPPGLSFLYGFDISACSVATDGCRYWVTPPAAFAIANRLVVVDPLNTSPSAPNRIWKYFNRLGGMVLYGLPGFSGSDTLNLCAEALKIDIAPFPCKGNQLAFALDPHRGFAISQRFMAFVSNYGDELPDKYAAFFSNISRVLEPALELSGTGIKMVEKKTSSSFIVIKPSEEIDWKRFVEYGLSKKDVLPLASIITFISRQIDSIIWNIDIESFKLKASNISTLKRIIDESKVFRLMRFTEADIVKFISYVMELISAMPDGTAATHTKFRVALRVYLTGLVDAQIVPHWHSYPEDPDWTVVINSADPQNRLTTTFTPTPMTPNVFYTITDGTITDGPKNFDRGKVDDFRKELIRGKNMNTIISFGCSGSNLNMLSDEVLNNFAVGIRAMLLKDTSCVVCMMGGVGDLNMAVLKCGHSVHVSNASCAGLFSLIANDHVACSRCKFLEVRFNAAEVKPVNGEDQASCAICMDSIGGSANTALLSCGHKFHVESVDNACGGISRIKSSPTEAGDVRACPLCRAPSRQPLLFFCATFVFFAPLSFSGSKNAP